MQSAMARRIAPLSDLVSLSTALVPAPPDRAPDRPRAHAQGGPAGNPRRLAGGSAGADLSHPRPAVHDGPGIQAHRSCGTSSGRHAGSPTQVYCVSHSVREVVVAEGLCAAGKIEVLLGGSINGVDAVGRFDPERLRRNRAAAGARRSTAFRATPRCWATSGRIVGDKGIAELVAAWTALRGASYPDLHLLVVGPFEAPIAWRPAVEQHPPPVDGVSPRRSGGRSGPLLRRDGPARASLVPRRSRLRPDRGRRHEAAGGGDPHPRLRGRRRRRHHGHPRPSPRRAGTCRSHRPLPRRSCAWRSHGEAGRQRVLATFRARRSGRRWPTNTPGSCGGIRAGGRRSWPSVSNA